VLLKEGRLTGREVDGVLWLRLEDIERWRQRQETWWSKSPKKGRVPMSQGNPPKRWDGGAWEAPEVLGAHYRITLQQAAEMLGVTTVHMQRLAKQHGLSSVRAVCPEDVLTKRAISPYGRAQLWFLLGEVTLLEVKRERDSEGRGLHPGTWTGDLRRPIVRTELEAPPGDRLITVKEAALLLDVVPAYVRNLVRRARLFSWQARPGHPGCRVWLSEAQVLRYRERPERLKGREARERGLRKCGMREAECGIAYPPAPSLPGSSSLGADGREGVTKARACSADEEDEEYEEPAKVVGLVKRGAVWVQDPAFAPPAGRVTERQRWREEAGLGDAAERSSERCWGRSHGAFYSTGQTAAVLGVPILAVKRLRDAGRLTGHKLPPNTQSGGGSRWWFYRKEEVLALLDNAEYLARRERGRRPYRGTPSEPDSLPRE
jgi:hypothetical protein